MPTSLPSQTLYPTLGYLTRRQPPGSGIPPGTELPSLEAEAAVAG
ncbi:MAG: hypothetical protein QOI63_1817 [Thermoplasmata archaeon]|nr:hypothetical protein [Thermoplasmata archaeon]